MLVYPLVVVAFCIFRCSRGFTMRLPVKWDMHVYHPTPNSMNSRTS